VINFSNPKVLEIGTGTGLTTNALKELGVINYTGVDITDVLFESLQQKFVNYKFLKLDITTDVIDDKFDLIVIIDVIEHIVDDKKFKFAMDSIRNSLNKNGVIVIAPIVGKNYKAQFYERHWNINSLKETLIDFECVESMEWENNFSQIYLLRKFQQQII
jgi:2-polyprenyl-3-methyl-5-hydroxy-6-metoxy-1,4-benzoquinol methylase